MERTYMTVTGGSEMFLLLILIIEVVPPEVETWFRNNSTDFSWFLFAVTQTM